MASSPSTAAASAASKHASPLLSPLGLAFGGFLVLHAMSAGASKAEEMGFSRALGAMYGLATLGAGAYLFTRVFGSSLAGVAVGSIWDDLLLGPLALMTFKRQWFYQTRGFVQRHYRATIAPWSYSEEPTERATESMRRGLASIRGYQSFFGNEAAVMAARYAR